MDNVAVKFGDGFTVEIGDIVILKTDNLSITNIAEGNRSAAVRILQVLNKSLDIKTATISLGLVDTNFSNASRYGLISPSSIVKAGTSGIVFTVESSYASKFGNNEYLKWEKYGEISIRVRNNSGSISGVAVISSWSGNTVTLATSLGFTPTAGMIMTLSNYNTHGDDIKFVYAFMRTTPPFDDGKLQYQQL